MGGWHVFLSESQVTAACSPQALLSQEQWGSWRGEAASCQPHCCRALVAKALTELLCPGSVLPKQGAYEKCFSLTPPTGLVGEVGNPVG